MNRSTSIPRHMTPPEAAAVKHLLRRSALADCHGTLGRLFLTNDDTAIVIRDLTGWGWSSGELVLIDAVRFVLGTDGVRWPDVSRLDEPNQQVVREAIRYLAEGEASAQARLLRAVETS